MLWSDAKALGIFLWLRSHETMVGFLLFALYFCFGADKKRKRRKLTWRTSLAINSWRATIEIQRNVACSTLPWGK